MTIDLHDRPLEPESTRTMQQTEGGGLFERGLTCDPSLFDTQQS